MATWLAGDWPARGSYSSRDRNAPGDPDPRASFWCSPYCRRTFRTEDERSVHRTECAGYARFVDQLPLSRAADEWNDR